MKPSLAPYFLIALFLLFSFVCLAESHASQDTPQYLKLYSLYVFEYQDTPPFETIRTMVWNEATGFSEVTDTPDYLYTLVTVEGGNLRHGYVMRDSSSGACFFLEMSAHLGIDGQPHVDRHEWVTCPE